MWEVQLYSIKKRFPGRAGLGLRSVVHKVAGESLRPERASQAECLRLVLDGKDVKEEKLQTK